MQSKHVIHPPHIQLKKVLAGVETLDNEDSSQNWTLLKDKKFEQEVTRWQIV